MFVLEPEVLPGTGSCVYPMALSSTNLLLYLCLYRTISSSLAQTHLHTRSGTDYEHEMRWAFHWRWKRHRLAKQSHGRLQSSRPLLRNFNRLQSATLRNRPIGWNRNSPQFRKFANRLQAIGPIGYTKQSDGFKHQAPKSDRPAGQMT